MERTLKQITGCYLHHKTLKLESKSNNSRISLEHITGKKYMSSNIKSAFEYVKKFNSTLCSVLMHAYTNNSVYGAMFDHDVKMYAYGNSTHVFKSSKSVINSTVIYSPLSYYGRFWRIEKMSSHEVRKAVPVTMYKRYILDDLE